METRLTDTLCTRCGLCCDGTLFAEVELAHRAEALMDAGAAAERTRLRRAMHALERQILAVFLEGRGPKD